MDYIPAGTIGNVLPQLDSREFSPDVYRKTGVFVLRQAIPDALIRTWQAAGLQFCEDRITGSTVC